MDRVTFYVDGFNFYYGLKHSKRANPQWGRYYWIDFVKLFSQFLGPDQQLEKVIYFTASPMNPQKNSRQSALMNANKLLNKGKFELVRGKYINKTIECPNCHFAINRPEEKKTDVNISLRMVEDCIQDKTDTLVLVSADSDLVPPIELIQRLYPAKKIRAYFPPSRFSNDIKDNLLHHRSKPVLLEKNIIKFENSRMPNEVRVGADICTKPSSWM